MHKVAFQTFGNWLKARRRTCDVTQVQLARRVGCAEITIRKIEADDLRPSKHLARLLLHELGVRENEQSALMSLARRNHHGQL
jgi:DNA-binding XRE family transcriptional regulator